VLKIEFLRHFGKIQGIRLSSLKTLSTSRVPSLNARVSSDMEKTKNTRTRAPCEEDWDEIRPDLEQHYIEERLPLKKVAKILEAKYEFRAT
jgi:hypothetical protein